MTAAEQIIERMFLSVMGISVTAGVIIVFMLVCAPLFQKRYAVKWKYLIWIFLAVRLVIPFGVEDVQYMVEKAAQKNAGAGLETKQRLPGNMDGSGREQTETAGPRFVLEIPGQALKPITLQTGEAFGRLTPLMVSEGIWLFGAVLFLAVHIGGYLHYKRRILGRGRPVEDDSLLRQTASLRHELRIRSKIRIVECRDAASPMIMGFIRPVLVLPEPACRPEELYFILKHELVHLKRHDVWWKLLFVAANAVHWFNPMIWIMHKEAIVDMELACDERVIQGTDFADRKAYTETLLSMLHKRSDQKSALTTQFYGGKQIMQKRFRNILRRTKGKNGIVILLGAAVLTVGLSVFAGCSVAGGEEETGETVPAMVSGIVSNEVDVPAPVLEEAEELVAKWFADTQASVEEADYWDWWIASLSSCHVYEDFHGMELHVYQLDHKFLAGSPENVALSGGMSIDEEGWVTPDYANSRFLIFRQEGDTLSYITYLMENDCLPGDEVFDQDLEQQLQEMGMTAQEENPKANANADTAMLSYTLEGEIEEEPATIFVGDGYSIYVPDNWSLYAPDSWSYIFNEQLMFRIEHFEGRSLEQVQADLAASYGMSVDGRTGGKLEMAAQQGDRISRVRLVENAEDIWAVFYSYPEEALEGAGARLPVIVDTFTVTGASGDAQPWQSRPARESFWDLAPETNFSVSNTIYFANGLQIILPEAWIDQNPIRCSGNRLTGLTVSMSGTGMNMRSFLNCRGR